MGDCEVDTSVDEMVSSMVAVLAAHWGETLVGQKDSKMAVKKVEKKVGRKVVSVVAEELAVPMADWMVQR